MELFDKTMDEAQKFGLGFSPSNPSNNNEIHATLDPQFTTDVHRLKFNQGGAGIRTTKNQSFFLNTMANIGPQMIDSTDAKCATTRGLFNILKPTFGERPFDESNKEQHGRNSSQTARGTGLLTEKSSKGAHQASLKPSKEDSNNGLECHPRVRSRGEF
jgi:hypothetical protein